jgi:arginine decarboxylase
MMKLIPKDHSKAPILEGIKKFYLTHKHTFSVPGHKQGKGIDPETSMELGQDLYYNDMAVLIGVDDRKQSEDYQGKAEELAADAYGADKCFFSTNGTSLSVHAAIMSVANEGEKILVSRNCHFSMIAGIIISRVEPIFLEPTIDEDWDVSHGIAPDTLEKLLKENSDVKGVFIVSPDYFGVTSDVKTLSEICHKYNKPLIIDEAWGPHFAFCKNLPASAISSGADLAMGSLHKTMTALGQSSVIMLKGDRVPVEKFQQVYHLFETTSPSSLIMASMDASRRQMKLHGEEIWNHAIDMARMARTELSKIEGIRVMGKEVLGPPGMFDLDETKIVMDMKPLGVSGFEASDWLWKEKNVGVELADHRRLMALFTVADDEASVAILISAMKDLASWARNKKNNSYTPLPDEKDIKAQIVMRPSEAYFGPKETVKLEDAVGRIAAETVSPYPPGISRLAPGELITKEIVEYLKTANEAGMFQEDASDPKLKTIKVVLKN